MYHNRSTFNEDVHINNEADQALLDTLTEAFNKEKVKKAAASAGKKAAGAAIGAVTTMAIKDFVEYGDPTHSAKQGVAKAKENIESHKAKKAEEQRQKELEKEYDDWKKEQDAKRDVKKAALKESSCPLLIDEDASTAYYQFRIPEGA